MELLEILRGVSEYGLSFMLAAIVIYWYRTDTKERMAHASDREKEALLRVEIERADKIMVIEVVKNNTEALVRLQSTIHGNGGARGEFQMSPSYSGEQRGGK